jgi:hypothetical protein
MAIEGAAQGIDDLIDDVPETTEELVEQPAEVAEAAAEPAVVEAEESLEEAESQVAKLFAPVDHSGKTVPTEAHAKLRKRAQAAEAKVAELESRSVNVETDALAELSGLVEGDDDEDVDKKTLKEVISKLPDVISAVAQKAANDTLNKATMHNVAAKAKSDETAFRKDHADYDKVVDFVAKRQLLTQADLQEVFSSGNIAEAYYKKASAAIKVEREMLGVAQTTTTTDNSPDGQPVIDDEEQFENDDDAFDAFMGGGS